MSDKKILIFSTAYYPFVGGAEVAIKEITDRIPEIEFHLITARLSKKVPFKEKIGNVLVYRLGVGIPIIDKLLLPFEGALFVKHLQKKNDYIYFWCVMASFASGAAYIFNIFSREKTPIVLNLQEGDSEEHFSKAWFGLINLSWRLALRRTSYLTVLSQFLKDRALKFGYKGEAKIIPNGVDVERFNINLPEEEKIKIRESFGLRENDVILVTTSRLVVKNGIEDVIKAISTLPEHIKFLILGEGELEKRLKLIVKNLKIEKRVIFKGYVSHEEIPRILKSCNMFIRTSLSEGMGNSFIEAMAARIPVIATPVGGIVDFLRDGETGYFCKVEDPESIKDTVNRVIDDPNRESVIEDAYKMVREKYDWENIVPKMKEVFDKLTIVK